MGATHSHLSWKRKNDGHTGEIPPPATISCSNSAQLTHLACKPPRHKIRYLHTRQPAFCKSSCYASRALWTPYLCRHLSRAVTMHCCLLEEYMSHRNKDERQNDLDRMKTSLLDTAGHKCASLMYISNPIELHTSCLTTLFRHDNLEVCGNKKRFGNCNNCMSILLNILLKKTFHFRNRLQDLFFRLWTEWFLGLKGVLQKQGVGKLLLLKHMIVWGRYYISSGTLPQTAQSVCFKLCLTARTAEQFRVYLSNWEIISGNHRPHYYRVTSWIQSVPRDEHSNKAH